MLNLLNKALIFFVKHANVSFEAICLSLHVTIDLSPLVLLLAHKLVLFGNELSHLVALSQELALLLLQLAPQAPALSFERLVAAGALIARVKLAREVGDALAHELVLALEAVVLTAEQTLVVGVGLGHAAGVIEALVKRADSILLGHDLTRVVLHHSVALVLKALVAGLGLNKLSLQLLNLHARAISSCK